MSIKIYSLQLVAVLVLCGGLVFPALLRAQMLENKKSELSDTEFVIWLQDYAPVTKSEQVKKHIFLAELEQLPSEARLEHFKNLVELEDKIVRPARQLALALQEDRRELARAWLEKWLQDDPRRNDFSGVMDVLLTSREFEWLEESISTYRDRYNNSTAFFRRMGAGFYARSKYREALDEYFAAAERLSFSSYIRLRIVTIVERGQLSDYFLEKIAASAEFSRRPSQMLDLAFDYFVRYGEEDKMNEFLEQLQGSDDFKREEFIRQRDRMLDQEKPGFALAVNNVLKGLEEPVSNTLSGALLNLALQDTHAALTALETADTEVRENMSSVLLHKVKAWAYLLAGEFDSAAKIIAIHGSREELLDEKIALLKAEADYEKLIELTGRLEESKPWLEFYADYMVGEINREALDVLSDSHPETREAALALALASVDERKAAVDFLSWLAKFPLNSSIKTFPPQEMFAAELRLPGLLIEEWYNRFQPAQYKPATLFEWGQKIAFPQLWIDAAKKYENQGEVDRAREIIEEMLIEFPESMHRFKAENYLRKIS